MNAARAVGPAVAGILIATVGVSICFLVNAGSYLAVIASLLLLDRSALRPSLPAPRAAASCARACATWRARPPWRCRSR